MSKTNITDDVPLTPASSRNTSDIACSDAETFFSQQPNITDRDDESRPLVVFVDKDGRSVAYQKSLGTRTSLTTRDSTVELNTGKVFVPGGVITMFDLDPEYLDKYRSTPPDGKLIVPAARVASITTLRPSYLQIPADIREKVAGWRWENRQYDPNSHKLISITNKEHMFERVKLEDLAAWADQQAS